MESLARASLAVLRTAVLVLDEADVVVLANAAARRMGLASGPGDTLALPEVRALARRARHGPPGTGVDVELDLYRGQRGDPLGVRVLINPLSGGYLAVEVEDVTDAHRLARVRRDFVANVSHELKTPVGALQLLAEALVDAISSAEPAGFPEPAAARRFAERIRHESRRLGRLVTELLELSRLQGGEPLPTPEPVRLDRVLREVLDRTRTAAAAKDITVRRAGERGVVVYGHEGQLVTAVANLVDNAVAYSPEQTTVTISVTGTAGPDGGSGGGTDGAMVGPAAQVSVTDQGIGIAAEEQSRIFERFYRADPARSRATGGTGLGLAIVKHIAANHGGRVNVASELGVGSTFTLTLPAGPRAATDQPPLAGQIVEQG